MAQTPSDVERRVADLEEQLAALKAELKKEPLPPTVAGLDRALQPVSITGDYQTSATGETRLPISWLHGFPCQQGARRFL